MIRPILLYGDPALRTVSMEIDKDSKLDVEKLISDMFETMHRANGIGLSAIQIGVPLRLFVAEAHLPEEEFHFRGVFINPKITREFGMDIKHPEGCLSVPGLTAMVERKDGIEMEWYDEKWEYHKQEFRYFASRIIQHEYDHLEGKIFTDRVSPLKKMILKRKLVDIASGKVKPDYKIKN